MYYPALELPTSRISQTRHRALPERDLVKLCSAIRRAFHSLLKHLEFAENVAIVLAAFDPLSLPRDPWELVGGLSVVFPQVIFPELANKINATIDTHGARTGRGNKWKRKKLEKDLLRCQARLFQLHGQVVGWIVANEESKKDPTLLAVAHIVENILEYEKSSVKELLERLG